MFNLSIRRSATFMMLLLLPALALAAACSSAEPEAEAPAAPAAAAPPPAPAPAPTTPPAAPAQAAPTAAPEAMANITPPRPADANAQTGGVLNVAYFRKASSPDGYQAGGTFDRMYFFTGNEVLVAIGKDSVYDPSESLAYSFEVEDGGSRVRFNLREGVQFQGGFGEMTSEDVSFSLNRWFDAESGCRGCPSTFRSVTEVNAIDDYTVDVVMDPPDANLVVKMFDRGSIVHNKEHWETVGPDDHKSNAIATGPYKLTLWDVGVTQNWVKHPDWWRHEPFADEVNIQIISETRTRLAALQTGEVNVSWLQAEQIPAAQKDDNIDVWDFTGVGWDGWGWNHGLAPLDDLRLRRALIKSVDRVALNKSIYLNTLRDSQAHTFPPESPFGIDAKDLWEGEHLRYNLDEAKALVEEVAADKGLTLPLQITGVCDRRPDRQQFCEFLQGSWTEIGVEYEFQIVSNASERADVMEQCQTHINQTGWGMLLPWYMEGALHSSANGNFPAKVCKDQGSALDADGQAIQDQLDTLFAEASESFDTAEQIDKYKQIQRIALENLYTYIPAMLRVNYVGCHTPTTGGCETNPMRGDGFVRNGDFWIKQ